MKKGQKTRSGAKKKVPKIGKSAYTKRWSFQSRKVLPLVRSLYHTVIIIMGGTDL